MEKKLFEVRFLKPAIFFFLLLAERPRSPLPLTPTLSIAIGLGAAILIGSCAIVLAFKFPCGGGATRRRNKDTAHHNHQSTTVRTSSPGPSDKSVASKEYDGNESDEKNPDVIPDTIDSDDQVSWALEKS